MQENNGTKKQKVVGKIVGTEKSKALAGEMFDELWRLVRGPYNSIHVATMGECATLEYLSEQESPVSPTELSRFFNVSTARITTLINQLERKCYVRRMPVPDDRRTVLIQITEAGQNAAKVRKDVILRYLQELMDELGEKDAREYIRLIRRITAFCGTHPFEPKYSSEESGVCIQQERD